jgi:PDDEXK-like domain of unknown function (DUF3799)
MTTTFAVGERVWWQTADTTIRHGTIRILEDRPGIQPDDDTDLLYLDPNLIRPVANRPDGIYAGISDTDYHADRTTLSSSGARTLTVYTPAEYLEQLLTPPNPKPQYDFGHAAHKMILGEGAKLVRVDAPDWRTKAARESREKAWEHGKVPMLKAQIDQAQIMAGKVFQHGIAAKLLQAGAAELSGYWTDPDTGVRLRFRPDFLPDVGDRRPVIVDVKTSVSASPKRFAKSAADYGYHQQAAWYTDGLAATTGATDAAFLFVVVQKDPPHLVSVCQLDPEAIDLGHRQNRAAIDLYARCKQTNTWPGYEGIHNLSLPRWAVSHIENELEGRSTDD